jgi:hypothetical protein
LFSPVGEAELVQQPEPHAGVHSGIRSSLPRNRSRFRNSRRWSPRTLGSSSITSIRIPAERSQFDS